MCAWIFAFERRPDLNNGIFLVRVVVAAFHEQAPIDCEYSQRNRVCFLIELCLSNGRREVPLLAARSTNVGRLVSVPIALTLTPFSL